VTRPDLAPAFDPGVDEQLIEAAEPDWDAALRAQARDQARWNAQRGPKAVAPAIEVAEGVLMPAAGDWALSAFEDPEISDPEAVGRLLVAHGAAIAGADAGAAAAAGRQAVMPQVVRVAAGPAAYRAGALGWAASEAADLVGDIVSPLLLDPHASIKTPVGRLRHQAHLGGPVTVLDPDAFQALVADPGLAEQLHQEGVLTSPAKYQLDRARWEALRSGS
jgi:hypothetical protein